MLPNLACLAAAGCQLSEGCVDELMPLLRAASLNLGEARTLSQQAWSQQAMQMQSRHAVASSLRGSWGEPALTAAVCAAGCMLTQASLHKLSTHPGVNLLGCHVLSGCSTGRSTAPRAMLKYQHLQAPPTVAVS